MSRLGYFSATPSARKPLPDVARSLRDPQAVVARRAMLGLPHAAPLAAYAARLRAACHGQVPDFDPEDGGVNARALFLLEKPGPMTDPMRPGRAGSGFVSRDNDDPTAEAIFHFMRQAGLPRGETVIWNAVPWWNGRIALTRPERSAGMDTLPELLGLLPHLDCVVLVGRVAAQLRPTVAAWGATGLRVVESAHPSPNVRSGYPARWAAIPDCWRLARAS